MFKNHLTKTDVNWENPNSVAALLLTAKAAGNAVQAEKQKSPIPKAETPAGTSSEKPKI